MFEGKQSIFSQDITIRILIWEIDEGKPISLLKERLSNIKSSKYIYLDLALFHPIEPYYNAKERC